MTTKSENFGVLSSDSSSLVTLWHKYFGIDVSPFFPRPGPLSIRRDQESGIGFFDGSFLPADEKVYMQLASHDWYYDPFKWEFKFASKLVEPGESVLDVGCGDGAFLQCCVARGIPIESLTGSELNKDAAEKVANLGFKVVTEGIVDEVIDKYDFITAFQLLEHVPDPVGFLEKLMKLLRPGGRLIISVPNWNSLFGRTLDPLDWPPHHCSRWDEESFAGISRILRLKLVGLKYEPLRPMHFNRWRQLFWQDFRESNVCKMLYTKPVVKSIDFILPTLRRFFRGHTILGVFKKY